MKSGQSAEGESTCSQSNRNQAADMCKDCSAKRAFHTCEENQWKSELNEADAGDNHEHQTPTTQCTSMLTTGDSEHHQTLIATKINGRDTYKDQAKKVEFTAQLECIQGETKATVDQQLQPSIQTNQKEEEIDENDSIAANQKQSFRNANVLEGIDKAEESSKVSYMLGNNKCEKRSSFSRMALQNQKSLPDEDRNTGNGTTKYDHYADKNQIDEENDENDGLLDMNDNNNTKNSKTLRKLSLRSKTMKEQTNQNLNIFLGDFSPYINLRAEGSPLGQDGTWSRRHNGIIGSNSLIGNSQLNAFSESPISTVNKNDQSCNFVSDTTYQEDLISEYLLHSCQPKVSGSQIISEFSQQKEHKSLVQEEENEEEGEEGEETASNFINLYKTAEDNRGKGCQSKKDEEDDLEYKKEGFAEGNLHPNPVLLKNTKLQGEQQQKQVKNVPVEVVVDQRQRKNSKPEVQANKRSEKSSARSSSKLSNHNRSQTNIPSQSPTKSQQQPLQDPQKQSPQIKQSQQKHHYFIQQLKSKTAGLSQNKTAPQRKSLSKDQGRIAKDLCNNEEFSNGKHTVSTARVSTTTSNRAQTSSLFSSIGGKSVPCLSQFYEQSIKNRLASLNNLPQHTSYGSSLAHITTANDLEEEHNNNNNQENKHNSSQKEEKQEEKVEQQQQQQLRRQQKPIDTNTTPIKDEQLKKGNYLTVDLIQKHQVSIHQHLSQRPASQDKNTKGAGQQHQDHTHTSKDIHEAIPTIPIINLGNHKSPIKEGIMQQTATTTSSPGQKHTLAMIANELSKSSRNTAQPLVKNTSSAGTNNITKEPSRIAAAFSIQKSIQRTNKNAGETSPDKQPSTAKSNKASEQIIQVNLAESKLQDLTAHKRKSCAQISEVQQINRGQRTESLLVDGIQKQPKLSQGFRNEANKIPLDALFKPITPLENPFRMHKQENNRYCADQQKGPSESKSPKAATKRTSSKEQTATPTATVLSYSQIHARNHLNSYNNTVPTEEQQITKNESTYSGNPTSETQETLPVKEKRKTGVTSITNNKGKANAIRPSSQPRFGTTSTPSKTPKTPNSNNSSTHNILSQALLSSSPSQTSAMNQFQQIISATCRQQNHILSPVSETMSRQPFISPTQQQYAKINPSKIYQPIGLGKNIISKVPKNSGQNKSMNDGMCQQQQQQTPKNSLQSQQVGQKKT